MIDIYYSHREIFKKGSNKQRQKNVKKELFYPI